jgi:hypothetical protein
MMLLAAVALAAAPPVAGYDCVVDKPQIASKTDKGLSLDEMGLPPEFGWRFSLTVRQSEKKLEAEIAWPTNPIQINGKHAGVPLGKGAYAFVAPSGGPCLFTETGCVSMIQFSLRPDGTAAVRIHASAIGTHEKADTHDPLLVVIEGSCKPNGKQS